VNQQCLLQIQHGDLKTGGVYMLGCEQVEKRFRRQHLYFRGNLVELVVVGTLTDYERT